MGLVKPARKGQECFACSRTALYDHERRHFVHKGINQKLLSGILPPYAAIYLYILYPMERAEVIEAAEL